MITSRLKQFVSRFRRQRCPECHSHVRRTYCDVCGYDLIRQTRDKALHPPKT
jgi:ribosomal protein L37E